MLKYYRSLQLDQDAARKIFISTICSIISGAISLLFESQIIVVAAIVVLILCVAFAGNLVRKKFFRYRAIVRLLDNKKVPLFSTAAYLANKERTRGENDFTVDTMKIEYTIGTISTGKADLLVEYHATCRNTSPKDIMSIHFYSLISRKGEKYIKRREYSITTPSGEETAFRALQEKGAGHYYGLLPHDLRIQSSRHFEYGICVEQEHGFYTNETSHIVIDPQNYSKKHVENIVIKIKARGNALDHLSRNFSIKLLRFDYDTFSGEEIGSGIFLDEGSGCFKATIKHADIESLHGGIFLVQFFCLNQNNG